ncbi:MAG: hypothetical protein ACK5NF_07585 [Bacilli bacterium]
MKTKQINRIIIVLILCVIIGISIYIYNRVFNINYDENITLNEDTKLVITYTSPDNTSAHIPIQEKAEIFQLNGSGEEIEFNLI